MLCLATCRLVVSSSRLAISRKWDMKWWEFWDTLGAYEISLAGEISKKPAKHVAKLQHAREPWRRLSFYILALLWRFSHGCAPRQRQLPRLKGALNIAYELRMSMAVTAGDSAFPRRFAIIIHGFGSALRIIGSFFIPPRATRWPAQAATQFTVTKFHRRRAKEDTSTQLVLPISPQQASPPQRPVTRWEWKTRRSWRHMLETSRPRR